MEMMLLAVVLLFLAMIAVRMWAESRPVKYGPRELLKYGPRELPNASRGTRYAWICDECLARSAAETEAEAWISAYLHARTVHAKDLGQARYGND